MPKSNIQTVYYRDAAPIPEWLMTAGELELIPKYSAAIHSYADKLPMYEMEEAFYQATFHEMDIAMQENMGGGLPITGFYEMKQRIYEIALEDSDKHQYIPFEIGQVVSHKEIISAFNVGNMGGMRKSKAHNCLVLISDHTKGLYEDKWHGDVLPYTGMGKTGDQKLEGNQNKTLCESRTNGVDVHLFEVLNPTEYTYHGLVQLIENPYQDDQPDVNGDIRKVWMFPIKPIGEVAEIDSKKIQASSDAKQKKAESMSLSELKEAAEKRSSDDPGVRTVKSRTIERDEFISEYAKRLAKGRCCLCGQPAPFNKKDGTPYLETHHVIWLSKGGSDSIDNTVALCPNCHRKMHLVDDPEDVAKLKKIALKNENRNR